MVAAKTVATTRPSLSITGPPELPERIRPRSEVMRRLKGLNERQGVLWSDMAVFYRMNSLSRVMEEALFVERERAQATLNESTVSGTKVYSMQYKSPVPFAPTWAITDRHVILTFSACSPRSTLRTVFRE